MIPLALNGVRPAVWHLHLIPAQEELFLGQIRGKNNMETTMIPGCCGLKTIHKLGCLGKDDAFSAKEAEAFDTLAKSGMAGAGNWNTYGKALDTIAIITDSKRYHNDPKEFKKQMKFFEDKKWVLLATWKSYESGGKNYMYGNPGMTKE
jgi:hypothetical protein